MAKGICSVPGCGKPHTARGWCQQHYNNWRYRGSPMRFPASPVERFWKKVDQHGSVSEFRPDLGRCWLWTDSPGGTGAGRHLVNGQRISAHRFAYELLVGPIPTGLDIDHLCRVPMCVNPVHLEPVTRSENIRRGLPTARPGMRNGTKTHCPYGHPYDDQNTYMTPQGDRHCRTCKKHRAQKGHPHR